MGGVISYHQTKYSAVAGSTTDDSGGVVIPDDEIVGVFHFRANGSNPDAYSMLVWDWGGADQKVLASTRGDIDIELDVANPDNIVTGDGSKKLNVILVNDGLLTSQVIGGAWEATKIG